MLRMQVGVPRTQSIRLCRWLGVLILGAMAVGGCDSEASTDYECVVAAAPGHEWTSADAEEFVLQLHPPPGDKAERHALFVDGLTAFGAKEGGFDDYDPAVALGHHRDIMADFHFQKSFKEGTAGAAKAYSDHREALGLEMLECP